MDALVTHELPGEPSVFSCPECGGVLFELGGKKILRFRCHVGHGYTAEALVAAQDGELEAALWSGLRALEETIALRRRMLERATKAGLTQTVEVYAQQLENLEAQADSIRRVLTGHKEPQATRAGNSRRRAPKRLRKRKPPNH